MVLAKNIATIPHQKRRPLRVPPAPVYYPESNGEPMAETDVHRDLMVYLIEALKDYYRDDPQVYVAGTLLLYYKEGDPTASVAPDVLVVFGIPKRQRRVYKVWEEDKGPDVVFELTSQSTRWKDMGTKKGLYALLGVKEYYLFDPLGEYLVPPLQGYTLADGDYRLMKGRSLVSDVLGLELREEGGWLRLYDPETGKKLLTPLEAQAAHRQEAAARRQAEERAAEEAAARHRAEAELEHLRAELARLQKV